MFVFFYIYSIHLELYYYRILFSWKLESGSSLCPVQSLTTEPSFIDNKYLFNCLLLLIPLWSLVEELDNNAYEVVKMLNFFLFVNT